MFCENYLLLFQEKTTNHQLVRGWRLVAIGIYELLGWLIGGLVGGSAYADIPNKNPFLIGETTSISISPTKRRLETDFDSGSKAPTKVCHQHCPNHSETSPCPPFKHFADTSKTSQQDYGKKPGCCQNT